MSARASGIIGTEHVVRKSMADEMFRNSIGLWLEFSVCDYFRNDGHSEQDSYKIIFNWYMTKRLAFIINFGRFSGMRQLTGIIFVLMATKIL